MACQVVEFRAEPFENAGANALLDDVEVEEFDRFTETLDHAMWMFRRDDRIRRPVEQIITISASGIPIVRSEVQLPYMAASDGPKNQHGFEIAHRHPPRGDDSWLEDALDIIKPDHRWLPSLR